MSAQPVIRFCDLAKYINNSESGMQDTATQGQTTTTAATTSSSTSSNILPVQHVNLNTNSERNANSESVLEDNELDNELWEEEYDSDDEHNDVLMSAHAAASGSTMDIETDDGIDVSVPQLRDFLSDIPVSSLLVNLMAGSSTTMTKKAAGSRMPRVFQVPEIDF